MDLPIFGEGLRAAPPPALKGGGLRRLKSQVVQGRGAPKLVHLVGGGPTLFHLEAAPVEGCGRQALQPSRACQGLAGARQRPPTHSRRRVVGGFRA